MPRPNRRTVRISANIPAVIIQKWEELQARLNHYLPLPNRSHRIEVAILEHIRIMEEELREGPEGGGKGKRPRNTSGVTDEDEHGGPEQWHHQTDDPDLLGTVDPLHGYQRTG